MAPEATVQVEISLTEKQIQFLEASYTFPVVFYGGARGGGKSHGLRNIILTRCLERPNVTAAIFRKTFPELRSNIIEPLLQQHPWLYDCYNKSEHIFRLPNGSTIEACHMQNSADVILYQGREYDIIGIEEAGQWEEGTFHTLRGSNRSSKPGIKPVTLLTGNPGGIGHSWLKRLFVQRDFKANERSHDYHFISAKVYDCPPLLDNDPDYVSRLEAEPNEALRKAYLDGDWDVFAGQFFSEWRSDVHVVKPFQIPDHWVRFGAFDPGYFHPAAFGWFACDETGRVYMYREFIDRNMRIDEIAREVAKFPDTAKLINIQGGRDCWSTGRDGSPSISEQFAKLPGNMGLRLVPANTDRIQGASHVRSFLAWQNMPTGMHGPQLQIFETCKRTIECLPRLIHDPSRPEDVLKIDASESDPFGGDDAYDMLRYALMSRPRAAVKQEIEFKIRPYESRIKDFMKKRRERVAKANKGQGRDSTLGAAW
jgi:phage terminase large subunit